MELWYVTARRLCFWAWGWTLMTRRFGLLAGGSQVTHESMQEKCIKFNEKLRDSGKGLEQLDRQEFLEIAADCKMNVVVPKEPA